ncbi:C-C motif chemokine 20 [Xiphias gladius]|uniref:C-C motif chemokine 20 n=1 Tax=Xiphias gladius TaxID=8245 RepID=UPI001A998F7A|nr:C-C motif chemokine 20 [Xiphias gladius]
MRLNMLFLLLSLSCLTLGLAQVSYYDCCLKYVKSLNHKTQKNAVNYRWQETDGGCNITAIIFIMRRGRKFCADPREAWVLKLMKKLDKKGAKNDRKKYEHPSH